MLVKFHPENLHCQGPVRTRHSTRKLAMTLGGHTLAQNGNFGYQHATSRCSPSAVRQLGKLLVWLIDNWHIITTSRHMEILFPQVYQDHWHVFCQDLSPTNQKALSKHPELLPHDGELYPKYTTGHLVESMRTLCDIFISAISL